MAFGLGFNKTKVLSTAEKFVAQGKIPAAIEEYRKILQRDQKDLTILNTVADLCVRTGQTDEALKRFNELAEHCVDVGLMARAIATYKRITRIDPGSVQPVIRLGDLYALQGLLRDSRTHYLQAVEFYVEQHDKEKARDIFEKILMLDSENPQLQVRMAKFYAETGKLDDAQAMLLAGAERFLDMGKPSEATAALETLLALDPQNPEAQTLLGRSQLDQGETDRAIVTLRSIPSFEEYKAVLGLLFRAYSRLKDLPKSREIADRLFIRHDDFSGLSQLAEELISQEKANDALEIYDSVSENLLQRRASGVLVDGVRKVLGSEPSNVNALELLLKVFRAGGNVGDIRETTEQLAHAYRKRGDLEKARELYQELVTVEPENSDHYALLRHVEAEMGIAEAAAPAPSEAAAAGISDLSFDAEETAPAPALPPREEQLIKNCITEADLYKTYHQLGRAIETLENGLVELPGSIALSEHLLALYEQSQLFGKAADCCEVLTESYVKLGDGERASRFGELSLTYRQRAQSGESAAESAAQEGETAEEFFAARAAGLEMPPSAQDSEDAAEEPGVREVDLSMEWASVSSGDESSSSENDDEIAVEEIEFYLQAGLASDASEALDRFEARSPSHPAIAGFRERLGAAGGAPISADSLAEEVADQTEESVVGVFSLDSDLPPAPPLSSATASEAMGAESSEALEAMPLEASSPHADSFEDIFSAAGVAADHLVIVANDSEEESQRAEPSPVSGVAETLAAVPQEAAQAGNVSAPVLELSPPALSSSPEQYLELGEELPSMQASLSDPMFELSLESSEVRPHGILSGPKSHSVPPRDPFAELTGELEEAFSKPAELPAAEASFRRTRAPGSAPLRPADTAASMASVLGDHTADPLSDIFAEFKSEMDEPSTTQDLETHYNLGVAFKEMALYDEAIGEFQKAHQIAGATGDYSHIVQCCSLLATCFLEKGLPQLAVKWYRTALDSPGVDGESAVALLYEMGSANEAAGESQAALQSFLEVYARNIDYRDVATRIHSLRQTQ